MVGPCYDCRPSRRGRRGCRRRSPMGGEIVQRGKMGVDLVKNLEHPVNVAAAAPLQGAPFLSCRQVVETERRRRGGARQKRKGRRGRQRQRNRPRRHRANRGWRRRQRRCDWLCTLGISRRGHRVRVHRQFLVIARCRCVREIAGKRPYRQTTCRHVGRRRTSTTVPVRALLRGVPTDDLHGRSVA